MTPQNTTGVSPAELLLGRRPRTRLDLIKPNTADRVERKQLEQKARYDRSAKYRVFKVGDCVFVKNYGRDRQQWLQGTITKVTGPVSFVVKLQKGGYRRCHQDQLRASSIITDEDSVSTGNPVNEDLAMSETS